MMDECRHDRLDVLSRRGIALLVETAFVLGVVLPAVSVLVGETDLLAAAPGTTASWLIAFGVFFCLRDLIGGGTSPVKRLLGLRVVTERSRHRSLRLVLRNLVWVAGPNTWLIELLASARGKGRFGDRMVGTRVVDVARGRSSAYYTVPAVLVAYFLPAAAFKHIAPVVVQSLHCAG